MSLGLVAYGSSDESDTSDTEEQPNGSEEVTAKVSELSKNTENVNGVDTADSSEKAKDKGKTQSKDSSELVDAGPNKNEDPMSLIEDEEDYFPTSTINNMQSTANSNSATGIGLKLPPPKTSSNSELSLPQTVKQKISSAENQKSLTGPELMDDDVEKETSVQTSLLGLPVPKSSTDTSVSYDDELEDEVKPKSYGDTPEVPKPQPKAKKTRMPVKFIVPSLDDLEPEEDEEPQKKKMKPSNKKSGLFALLPQPKNMSVKTTGRALLPHTLKKPTPAKPAPSRPASAKLAPSTRSMSASTAKARTGLMRLAGVPDDDSDEEEESSTTAASFFSLGDKQKSEDSSETTSEEKPKASSSLTLEPSLRGPWQGAASVSQDLLATPPMFASANQPDDPIPESAPTQGPAPMEELPSPDLSDAPLSFNTKMMPGAHMYPGPSTHAHYQQQYAPDIQYQDYQAEAGDQATGADNFMQDEEFLKIQGKMGRRHEKISLIDVNPDNYLAPEDLIKNITEETSSRTSYSKKNKDLPSSQQRRKHQITYLAHQAKERELELKNTWANNKMTKKQTQSKYGF